MLPHAVNFLREMAQECMSLFISLLSIYNTDSFVSRASYRSVQGMHNIGTAESNNVVVFLCSGVAIQMSEALYAAPSLNAELTDAIFLQNLPSIVTVHVLNPQPGEAVLDMCAAPGDVCPLTDCS